MKKYVAELIGTMILVLMGCGSAVFAGSDRFPPRPLDGSAQCSPRRILHPERMMLVYLTVEARLGREPLRPRRLHIAGHRLPHILSLRADHSLRLSV